MIQSSVAICHTVVFKLFWRIPSGANHCSFFVIPSMTFPSFALLLCDPLTEHCWKRRWPTFSAETSSEQFEGVTNVSVSIDHSVSSFRGKHKNTTQKFCCSNVQQAKSRTLISRFLTRKSGMVRISRSFTFFLKDSQCQQAEECSQRPNC